MSHPLLILQGVVAVLAGIFNRVFICCLLGLGQVGFFKFGLIWFGFQSQVLGFGFLSVSVFTHHHNARVSQCVKTLRWSQ